MTHQLFVKNMVRTCLIITCLCAATALSAEITSEKAKEIALAQTGGGEVVELARHYGGDNLHYYRLEIVGANGAYHVEIDASTGRLVQLIRKRGFKGYRGNPPIIVQPAAPATGSTVTYEQALAMALRQTGGGTVVESEVDVKKHGRIIYEFEIINNGMKYEIEIDSFGNTIEFKQKGNRYYPPLQPQPIAPVANVAPQPAITSAPQQAGQPRLDIAEVQRLAKEHAGGGTVTGYNLDTGAGRTLHKVTVVNGNQRHELEINDSDATVRQLAVTQIGN